MSIRIKQKDLKRITLPDGSLAMPMAAATTHDIRGLFRSEVYDFIRAAEKHKDRFGYDYSHRNSRRLVINGICTDTSRGLDWRAVLRSWDGNGNVRGYYLAAGGGGYDFLAHATAGIKVFNNDGDLVEIGDHPGKFGGGPRPTLDEFVSTQGWYKVTW